MPGYDNLISIKGIGPLSVAVMLTHIGAIEDFKNTGKLAAYFGLVPGVSQSNDTRNSGHILPTLKKMGVRRFSQFQTFTLQPIIGDCS